MSVIILLLVFFSFMVFLLWFFYLNIYEVRFRYNFDPSNILVNKKYLIECKGINLLGKEIGYRDLKCEYIIQSDNSIINRIESKNRNNFEFTTSKEGTVELLLKSKYSLNPSLLLLQSKEI